jgi:hypothetical protein
MHRSIVSLFCCCLLVGSPGCAQMRKMFGRGDGGAASPMTMEKPAQPAEMKRLEPLVGTWTGTAEMVNPPKMAKGDGPATAPASTMPTSFEGASTMKYVLDGMAMRGEGWVDMGDGKRMNYVEYWTWDPRAKKYRTIMMSDWGEFGEGWATPDATGRNFTWTGKSQRGKSSGTIRLTDDRTMEWNMTEKGPHGKMQFKGTSRKS